VALTEPRTRLDWLLIEGAIDNAAYDAASELRALIEICDGRRAAISRTERSRMVGPVEIETIRTAARRRVEAVIATLGPFSVSLIARCVVFDDPWSATAGELSIDPRTAKRWTVTALQALGRAVVAAEGLDAA
jgi:hypothetical protein